MELVRYEDWAIPGMRHPGSEKMRLPAGRAFIHHAAGPSPIDREAEVHLLREYDKQHRRKGWNGIGYSFIVGPSGTVYEGRGDRVGAHTGGMNRLGFGICFLGNFTNGLPTPAAMQAAAELMKHLIRVRGLTSDFKLTGHRDHNSTACPGNRLYPELPTLRAMVTQAPAPEETDVSIPRVNAPVVAIAASYDADGNIKGYLLVGADGGVFAFGAGAPYLGRVEYVLPTGNDWTPAA